MGLDMFLNRKVFVGQQYDHRGVEGGCKFKIDGNEFECNNVSYVVIEGIYWRKSNQIHKWFVDNIQDGEDNCGTYYVPREALEELYKTVKKVLESRSEETAEELLPTQAGFFFGDTEYDEYYWDDLEYTKKKLEEEFEWADSVPDGFYAEWEYHSSW